MIYTKNGYEIMEQLSELYRELSGIVAMEQQLTRMFRICAVVSCSRGCEQDETVKRQLGKEAAQMLQQIAPAKAKIAVTGGSSVASMKEYQQKAQC